MVPPLSKTVWQLLTRTNRLPAVMLFALYTKELEIYVHTKTYTWMFVAVLSIIANT